MVFHIHDFTDSEPEDDPVAGPSSDAQPSPRQSPRPNPLRITLRPVHSPRRNESREATASPPPQITLKLRQKAAYSSSEDEALAKKPRSKPKPTTATVPAQHRKAYDWLQPGSASASHSGPPVRSRSSRSDVQEDLDEAEDRPKKSHKKRAADAPPGPGKNWRKGIKKQLKEGDVSIPPTPLEPTSRAPSEDIDLAFEKADPRVLGFPVFSKPIVPPQITLGTFPKVTSFFAPVNGGDVGPFPRKEKVRNWEAEEKTLVGVGGGTLRFKSWRRGPPSELGLLIQADAAAKDLQTKQKKERAAEALAPWGDRPLFTSTQSFESKDTDARSVEDVESEAGDEESVVGSVARRKPAKARPRKSKLAQEITVGSVE